MKFSESLKKNEDFRIVYAKGRYCGGKYFAMYVLKNSLDKNRLGISVSKKVGNSVARHRVTRLAREAYRLHEEMFEPGFDLVILARPASKGIAYQEAEREIIRFSHEIKRFAKR